MGDNEFFDSMGYMLFGKNNEQVNRIYDDFKNQLDSSESEEYIKFMDDNASGEIPSYLPEFNMIQKKIEDWTNEGMSDDDLTDKVSELLGNPISIKVVEVDGELIEEKTWLMSSGVLVRHKPLTDTSIHDEEEYADEILSYEDTQAEIESARITEDKYDEVFLCKVSVKSLQAKLDKALKEENYEFACVLRDKIKELES